LLGTLLPGNHLNAQAAPPPAQNSANSGAELSPQTQAQLVQLRSALQSAIAAHDARTAAKILNQIGEF
jgi:hypothetical protein